MEAFALILLGAVAIFVVLLLEETPVIFGYFPDLLVPVRKNVSGLPPIAAGLLLDRVSLG